MTIAFIGSSSSTAQACKQRLESKGYSVVEISRNISHPDNHRTFRAEDYSSQSLPSIDVALNGLVYFPGTINLKPFARISAEEFLKDFEINVLGAVHAIQKYLPLLQKSERSSIVLISSVAAQKGLPFHSSISTAKAALEGLTRALAAEFAPFIQVNAVAPSLLQTPLADRFTNTTEKLEAMKKKNPSRKVGSADDVAAMIEFLLSKEASWITGQVMAVDGGMSTLNV